MRLLLARAWKSVYVQIDIKNTNVILQDGTGTPVTLTIKIGEGNLTWSESRNVEYTLDRGLLDEVRLGDQVPMEVRLDATWEYVSGGIDTAAVGTPSDFFKQLGVFASNVSTDVDPCRPYAIDILVAYDPNCSAVAVRPAEDIILADFRYTTIDYDLRAGTIAFAGSCNVTGAVSTRKD